MNMESLEKEITGRIDLQEFFQDATDINPGKSCVISQVAEFFPEIDQIGLENIRTYYMMLGADRFKNITPLDNILENHGIARQYGYIAEDRSPQDPQRIGNSIYFKVQVLRVNGFKPQQKNVASRIGDFLDKEMKRLYKINRGVSSAGITIGHDLIIIDNGSREKIAIITSMARKINQS